MTREEFLGMIEGFEESPFMIISNGSKSSVLRFVKAMSDSVQVLSNNRPAAYKYESIDYITFDLNNSVETPIENEHSFIVEEAKRNIYIHNFSYENRNAQLKNALHNTPLEKEWVKTQNKIKDAQKNHILPEKIKKIINHLIQLPQEYYCIEYYIMLGEAYALNDDYDNAFRQFEIAGDYQNAAYYACKCEEKRNEYLLEILQKWIVSGKGYEKDVMASFLSLCYSMHRGRICAETIAQIGYESKTQDCQKSIYFGLILSLSNYVSDENELFFLKNQDVQYLLNRLKNVSASEQYDPYEIKTLKHANQIEDYSDNISTWEENLKTGYIIRAFPEYGYIGKEKSDNIGVKFNRNKIASKEIANLMNSSPKNLIGLKVIYILQKGLDNYTDIASIVESAEDLEEFIQKKGINVTLKTRVETAEEKLILNPDGKTYTGYINSIKAGFGFIYKENDPSQNGVFFHFSELEDKLKPIANKILGLKVCCELADSPKGEDADRIAVRIYSAESIDKYITTQAVGNNSQPTAVEEVDEAEVERMLRLKTPSAALQFFATTNRPLHALEVLERFRDSFTYDKYVKHKIQLLQRTRSSDNELISLLNYTISTSSDGAYIAHNLYFLGQVQYRCKLYSDVIATMTKLFKYKRFFKSPTQNTDSLFLISIAYYMLRDYVNADSYAKELLNLGAHIEEVNKILNRTFATEESIHDHVDDNETDYSLQFDSEVAITPYIEKLINSFSFGSISVRDVPSDFDPWLSDCTVDLANDYIQRLIRYDSRSEQKNNPNAAIAIAKIQKWLLQQSSEEEKEKIEGALRNNVSRALQIMSRNTLQQSGVDIRVNLFYRMQQYKMSIREKKIDLFNAYINAHFGSSWMNSLKPANNSVLKGTNHLLMVSDLLFLLSYMERSEVDDAAGQIEKICGILASRTDSKDYIAAIHTILNTLNGSYAATDKMYSQIISGSKAFHTWLNNNKRNIRDKAESKHWEELSDTLERLDKTLLSEYECEYLEKVREIARYLIDIDKNAQTAMKQNVLNQSKNQLNELDEKLQEEPTFILYSLFDDVLSIMNNSVLSSLAEVMSHEPDIEPVGTLQMNLGLTDSKEFILPLEFRNHLPSVQARNLTLTVESVTNGVSFITSSLPMAQNVDEGEKYSTSLVFRLDNSNISQVDISIKVEYSFDAFTNYTNERRSCTKRFNYTVTFREVESIVNKYRQYAGKQTVRDKSMFFGRDMLIRKLYDAITIKNEENKDILNGGNGVVLYGQRRSGKTSILHHLKEEIINNMLNTIVVDFGSIALTISSIENSDVMNEEEVDEETIQRHNSDMTLQTMYYTIIQGVRAFIRKQNSAVYDKLKADIKSYEVENNEMFFPNSELFANAQNPQLIFNAFLDRFRSVARVDDLKQGFRIVIIIDEFTYFNTAIKNKKLPYNFMEILKGIVSDSFITMVIAGQDNMVEFMERYMNEFSSFQREWVTFLEKDASFKMVTEPVGEDRIDPESAEKLYRFTAGSPYLLMLICYKLVDWMNENKIYKLASSLLDDFLADKYMKDYEFKEDLLEPQYKDAGRIEWTEKIKLVLGLIARQNSKKVSKNVIPWVEFDDYAIIRDDMLKDRGVSPEEMHEILERLVKRQVIETQEGYLNRFRIKIPLCREWILRRGGSEYGNE